MDIKDVTSSLALTIRLPQRYTDIRPSGELYILVA
jgi:hypothetical protein